MKGEQREKAKPRRARKAASMLTLAAAMALACAWATPTLAHAAPAVAGRITDVSAVTDKMNVLKDLVSSVLSGVGTVVCLWAISEMGLSMQSNDGMTQSQSLKRLGGGLLMVLAPQILSILI